MANTPTNPGYYPSAPAQQQVSYQQVPVQMQQGYGGHAQQPSAAQQDLAKRMEQMETQRKLDSLTHANEMLQLKMENQRDVQLRDQIHTQSTMMAMSAAGGNNNAPAAAPIVIQGPTISNVSTGYGAPAAGGVYGAPPQQQYGAPPQQRDVVVRVVQPQQPQAPPPKRITSRRAQQILCPRCNKVTTTNVQYVSGMGTYLSCVGISFCTNGLKDAKHRCETCKTVVGSKRVMC